MYIKLVVGQIVTPMLDGLNNSIEFLVIGRIPKRSEEHTSELSHDVISRMPSAA